MYVALYHQHAVCVLTTQTNFIAHNVPPSYLLYGTHAAALLPDPLTKIDYCQSPPTTPTPTPALTQTSN